MTVRTKPPAARRRTEPPPPRRARRTMPGLTGVVSLTATVGWIVLGGIFAEAGVRAGWWEPDVLPAPSEILPVVGELVGSPEFGPDAWRTLQELVFSCLFGIAAGLLVGVGFWKAPGVGRVFEPYLVSFYAVPLVLFYPVSIVLIGINQWSVITLASIMTAVPVILNTWMGLRSVPPVYLRLAESIRCSPAQTLFRVAMPAAAPYVFAGVRLGVVYALIGTIAMEFTTAQAGLGYKIRYLYESFDAVGMYAYIVVVLAASVLITAVLEGAERLLLRRRTVR